MDKERSYIVFYWVGDDHDEMEFTSWHRAGSRANRSDAMREIRRCKGAYIADRAEIIEIRLYTD